MFKLRFPVLVMALIAASAVYGQDAPAMDPATCAKHGGEMAAAHQKMMEQRQAAWKEIEAQLEVARNARGDQKVAALESVVEKLVAFQAPAMGDCPMMSGHGPGHMAKGSMDCCGGGDAATGPAGHGPHCPMMKGGAKPPETSKPAH
jgi:hypothetical protein